MIRPLREGHRMIVCALGVVLPLAVAAGLRARHPIVFTTLPIEVTGSDRSRDPVVWTRSDVWPGHAVLTRVRRDAGGRLAIELAVEELVRPDVLVYWTARPVSDPEELPGDARLLGPLAKGRVLPLVPEAETQEGRLVLYSLADHQPVAFSRPLRFGSEANTPSTP